LVSIVCRALALFVLVSLGQAAAAARAAAALPLEAAAPPAMRAVVCAALPL
jgi:hypothetical protein